MFAKDSPGLSDLKSMLLTVCYSLLKRQGRIERIADQTSRHSTECLLFARPKRRYTKLKTRGHSTNLFSVLRTPIHSKTELTAPDVELPLNTAKISVQQLFCRRSGGIVLLEALRKVLFGQALRNAK